MAQMTTSTEYGMHCLLWLVVADDTPLSSRDLAELQGISPSFLAKIFPKLEKAGIVNATGGVRGGYRLARAASTITLWDILEAIEGEEPAFRCSEIRQQGPCHNPQGDFRRPCEIHAAFNRAELAWRAELKSVTLADMAAEVGRKTSPQRRGLIRQWLEEKLA